MRDMKNNVKRLMALVMALVITTAFMPPLALEAFAAADETPDIALVDDKETFLEGEKIKLQILGSGNGSWVGMYAKGDNLNPQQGGVKPFRSVTTSAYDGYSIDFSSEEYGRDNTRGAIVAGEYEIILFGDSGYDDPAKRIPITIAANPNYAPPSPSDELTLKLENPEKTTYKLGESIFIRATGTAENAWVALYDVGAVLKDPNDGGDRPWRWFYIGERNGRTVDLASSAADSGVRGQMAEGSFELILFGDDTYDNIITKIPLSIEGTTEIDDSQFDLKLDKAEYNEGEEIRVMARGTGQFDEAWVGLYPADVTIYKEAYSYAYYVRKHEGIMTVIQDKSTIEHSPPVITQGEYKMILFADNGYDKPVRTIYFTVKKDVKYVKKLKDPTCENYGMEFVTYVDDTTDYRTISQLGHDMTGLEHIEGTATHKHVCVRQGCEEAIVGNCTLGEGKVTVQASTKQEGTKAYTCSVCSGVYEETIPMMKSAPKLKKTTFVYTGKQIKPAVKAAVTTDGKTVNKAFTKVKYPASKKAGTYTVKVTYSGDYKGEYKLTYKILPKAVSLKKVTKGKKSIKVTWKKAKADTTGYQIAYSTNKNFKNVKYVKVKGIKKTSTTIKKLKAGKKYYVKIRAYKTKGGKPYYSAWSVAKTVTPKK